MTRAAASSALLLLATLRGTAVAQTPQFDVASIRENVNGVRVLLDFKSSGNRVEYIGYSIPALVAEAWNVRGDQIALAPDVPPATVLPLMESGRSARVYEIQALAPEGSTPSRDEFRLMLRALLVSRFKLATHTEKRDKDVYVMTVDGTARLKPNTGEGTCRANVSRTPEGQRMVATHCPVQTMFNTLFVDRPIYDETGLTGFYDFEVSSSLPFQSNDPQAVSPFTAVKDLGLKIEGQRRPVDTIVIDHVEPPTEN